MITLYGRMPVLEALLDERAVFDKVLVARTAHGEAIDRIVAGAAQRGVRVERADAPAGHPGLPQRSPRPGRRRRRRVARAWPSSTRGSPARPGRARAAAARRPDQPGQRRA